MVFISVLSLSGLLVTVIHIFLLSSSAVVGLVDQNEEGSDENAIFAQIMINNREYRIETPRLSGPEIEAQLVEFHPSDTCVPFSGGTYDFVEPIEQVNSARLIGGPPGFGFVLWSDTYYEYVSGSVNWDKPNLDRLPIPWIEEIDPDEYARMQPQHLMLQANRIIWWIRQDPSNEFVAIAQYADSNLDVSYGTAELLREHDINEFPIETRLLDFASVSISSPDWFVHRRKRVARWKVSSLYEGKKVFRLTVPEMPTTESDDRDINDIENSSTELRCYAESGRPWQADTMVWPDRSLFVDDKSIKDLVCY